MPNPNYDQDDLLHDSVPDGDSPAASSEEISLKRQEKQKELIEIRRLQEKLLREAEEYDEFIARTGQLTADLSEITTHLGKSLALLEQAGYDNQKTLEEIKHTRSLFQSHMEELSKLEKIAWNDIKQKKELTQALTLVENARSDFKQAQARLEALGDRSGQQMAATSFEDGPPPSGFHFMSKVMEGLAFHFFLIIAILILAAVIFSRSPH
ncbi:MAG: hypothetical protein SFY92_01480 [Verrucomicrobiae bacterium]|nr:hypothetical protein [Verrucomicrobiae bacterium]